MHLTFENFQFPFYVASVKKKTNDCLLEFTCSADA